MSNIDRLKGAYADYNARRLEFAERDFAADIDWHMAGTPFPHMHSRDEVRAFFDVLGAQFAGHEIVLDDAVESGDRLVAFVTHRFTRHDGGRFEMPGVHDWTWRDGRAVRFYEVADNLAMAIGSGMIPAEALAGAGA